MTIDFSLTELGVPALLLGAMLVIAVATLLLHVLFPPAKSTPLKRTPPQLCPSCQQPLNEAERWGIRLNVCPRCQGVWLDQGKLEQIIG
jgi:hypothetical protein